MTINLTLFIQIVHFMIAYHLIEKLLLAPFMKVKNQERADQKIIDMVYENTHKQLELAEIQKNEEWKKTCKALGMLIPQTVAGRLLESGEKLMPTLRQPLCLSQEEQNELTQPVIEVITHIIRRDVW